MKKLYLLVAFSFICQVVQAQDYKREAHSLIEKNLSLLQLRSPDDVLITDAYPNTSSGALHVYIQQLYQGVRVANSIRSLVFKGERLLVQQGSFLRVDKNKVSSAQPSLKATDALFKAMDHLNLKRPAGFSDKALEVSHNGQEVVFESNGVSMNKIPATLMWVPGADGILKLTWQVGIHPVNETNSWMLYIDAISGKMINKKSLTIYCQWGYPHKHPDELIHHNDHIYEPTATQAQSISVNSATYRVIPYPFESPSHTGGVFTNVTNPWEIFGANNPATVLNWHSDGTYEFNFTRGNNVHAYLDEYDNNLPYGESDTSSTPLPDLTFTKDYNPDKSPVNQNNKKATVTNLFYWNNIIHDVMYQYGFDEASGNFQQNNLGRGGIGTDYVLAQAQDGSLLQNPNYNNANFTTPSDGNKPIMQMYLWNETSGGDTLLDSGLDNGIIVHEYGHGISTRLTGGPSQVGCLWNWEQMGEGWSDFYALMLTTDWSKTQLDDGARSRSIGTYAMGETTTGAGIRDYPYTTDMSINPFTYDDVRKARSSVHYIGSIWATMVWDMTWEIIRQTGTISPDMNDATANGGNVIAMRLVTEGLKLQPCSPGFVDGRDAILEADTLLFGGRYSCAIWRAFARRGLGVNASQGSSDSFIDQTASFDLPGAQLSKVADKVYVAPGEEITYTLNVDCGCVSFSNYNVVDNLPEEVSYVSGGTYDPVSHSVSFGQFSLNEGETATFTVKVINHAAYDRVTYFESDASTFGGWESTTPIGSSTWNIALENSRSAGGSWFVPNTGNTNTVILTSPVFTLAQPQGEAISTFSFYHRYNLEQGYDGGVLEISIDNGSTWQDLGGFIYQSGYNEIIDNCCGSYLSERPAFTGNSQTYSQTLVNLTSFQGQSIRLRFVFAEDDYLSNVGWDIDDLSLHTHTELTNTAFLMNKSVKVVTSKTNTYLRPSPLDIQSLTSGEWTNPATWSCNCVPQRADTATINPTHTVVVKGGFIKVKSLNQNEGNLELVNNATLELSNE